jgi:hypothetical protein
MRPEFADFVRLIYHKTKYQDHDTTKNKPNVPGFNSNIWFMNHKHLETVNSNLASKSNEFEALFISALANYVAQQKIKQSQITILSLYIAQVLLIKDSLRKYNLKEIKVVAVDNYQGEENDIILLSLVRSNKDNQIGFLKSFNRVCVALSRAILGFYVIGNFDCIIKGQSAISSNKTKFLWTEIYNLARNKQLTDDHLVFSCQKHNLKNVVRTLEDFKNMPEGGCKKPCIERLQCGHVCEYFCHNFDHERKQ